MDRRGFPSPKLERIFPRSLIRPSQASKCNRLAEASESPSSSRVENSSVSEDGVEAAATWHGEESARLEALGRPAPFADGQVAAIAHVNGLVLATTKEK